MPRERLRVLFVMHTAAPDGSSASLQHLIAHLPSDDVEPYVVSPREGPGRRRPATGRRAGPADPGGRDAAFDQEGMPLRGRRSIELGRTVLNLRHGRRLREVIENVRPDVVHLNERGMLQAAVIAHRVGARVVMHARSVADPRPAWMARLTRRVIRRNVDRVIAIDGSVARSIGPIADSFIVHNPVARANGHGSLDGRQPAPAHAGARVLYLASLAPAKGIWDLVAAAELLRGRTDIRFVIAGANGRSPAFHRSPSGRLAQVTGLIPDVESALQRRLASSRLEATVELVGQVEDPGPLIRSTDLLVFPSHHDGPGRSVIEAAIEGVPAVVALRHRVDDVVADGQTGLVVPPRDPAALAAAILCLADDPSLRSRLGAAARARAAERSDPAVVARRVVEIYRRRGDRRPRPTSRSRESRARRNHDGNGTGSTDRSIGPQVGGELDAGRDPAADDESELIGHERVGDPSGLHRAPDHPAPRLPTAGDPQGHHLEAGQGPGPVDRRSRARRGRRRTRRSPPGTAWRTGKAMRRCRCVPGESSFGCRPGYGRSPAASLVEASSAEVESSRKVRIALPTWTASSSQSMWPAPGRTFSSALGNAATTCFA